MKLPLNRKVVIAVVAVAVLSAAGGTYAATRGSDKAAVRPAGCRYCVGRSTTGVG